MSVKERVYDPALIGDERYTIGYYGYPGSLRWAQGEPLLSYITGLPVDYKENNNVGEEGTSSDPKGS